MGDTSRVENQSHRQATHTSQKSTLPSPLSSVNVDFFVDKMSRSSKKFSNEQFFNVFHDNPKDSPVEVVEGALRFIESIIRGAKESPKNSVLVDIFNTFCEKPIKSYVFQRMGKKILLELALRILQEIAQGGPARAGTLQLVVERAASGGKTVTIAEEEDEDQPEEFPIDKEFAKDIDEAFFRLHDSSGSSPDVTFTSRQVPTGRSELGDDDNDYATPKKSTASRSLEEEFDSAASGISAAAAFDEATSSQNAKKQTVSARVLFPTKGH